MELKKANKHIRNDLLLTAILLILAFAVWGIILLCRKDGAYAVVVIDGVETASYPLAADAEIVIEAESEYGHYNTLVISDGSASVISADCPDRLCVKQHRISKVGETITCLPHRVVIRITGADSSVDVVP